ncbi:exosome component 10 isoform X2 [Clupea harengus]|uniref:Exosome complex component 10 n=1 Tax=Clupea harengus TaxID=7950 RepID=A0A6P3VUD6_CLUHA|nr:exosome component 10 isoform X2 [Clupea harengus]
MAASTSSAGRDKQSGNSTLNDDLEAESKEFCPGFKDVDLFVKHGLGTVVAATKASAALPQAGDEYDLYRSFPGFQEFCGTQGDRILHCMSQLMQHHGCRSHLRDRNKLTGLDDRFDLVVDANDLILEKVGILLDEAGGVNRTQQPVMPVGYQPPKIVVSSWNRKGSGSGHSPQTFRLLHAKNVQRPQMRFKDKVDNSNTPFIPKIFVKPNATVPLPTYFTNKHLHKQRPEDLDVPAALADFIHQQRTQEYMEDMFSHPYRYELEHLTMSENVACRPEPQMYKPLDETNCHFIDTLDDLVALNEKLCKTTEFAVDLEHHSYRSFLGITCLMQISTRDEDFLVDTLELRSEMYVLNECFTDPNIVKVFHGADSDIEWLQKDFGLYVVNLFDTHQASRTLNLGRNSLDHLLKLFCNVDSDKRYQLADWRIRPLPEEMFQYAREDTHYLLYVYDRLRADLLDIGKGLPSVLQAVWHRSREISLKKYTKPIFTEESYIDMYKKQKRAFNTQQLTAFRLLYGWRDRLARAEDESTGYLLPNHMLLKISEELPKEPQGIIACCNPVPPMVRQQINELHQLMKQAREMPLLKAEIVAEKKKVITPKRKPLESSLFSPHDTSHVSEGDLVDLSLQAETPIKRGILFSEDEDQDEADIQALAGLVTLAKITLFEDVAVKVSDHLTVAQQKAHRIMESFENPFRMYLPSKNIHISENAKYDPSSKVYEIHNRWKLRSIEQQQKEAQEKQKAREQARKEKEERKKTKKSYQESLQNVATVRQQALEAGQTGGKRERVNSDVSEETPKPSSKLLKPADIPGDVHSVPVAKAKAKKASQNADTQQAAEPKSFTPFDYSKSNFKVFSGGKGKDSAQFDPNQEVHDPNRKKNPKGNKQGAVGGRSMSYMAGKSNRGFRHNWPKR